MLIRTTDINQLHELEQICFNHPYTIGILNDVVKSHLCYLIYENEIVAGYMIMSKIDEGYELIRIAILEYYQNQSYAKSALDEFMKKHQSDIYLEVSNTNTNAIKLYTSLDFKLINTRKNYYPDDSDALVMLHRYKNIKSN